MITQLLGTIPSDLSSKTPTALVDFETFYSKDYSASKLSYWHYTHDERFDAYRVSIVTNDGFRWVGNPKDAPWERIAKHVWVSHNRPFDLSVHAALIESKTVPAIFPPYWGDSMNLCAWIHVPRALAKAVKVLYGEDMDKQVRADMKGKKWSSLSAEEQAALDKYALNDGDQALRIWTDHVDSWPWKEIRISDLIMLRGLRGMYVNQEALQEDIDVMERVRFEALKLIPWCKDDPTAAVASKKNLDAHCRVIGIEPPPSLSKEDPGLMAWEDAHSEQHPFVRAMRDYNRAGAMLQKYLTIRSRIKPDGRFEFSISYLGTFTGRTSGTDKAEKRKGANMLNMPRDAMLVRDDYSLVYRKAEMKAAISYFKKHKKWPEGIRHGVYLRSKITPAPGHKFVIADKSQIEARITAWLSRDKRMLDLIRTGVSVYDAHAREFMGYVPKPDPENPGKLIPLKDDDPFTYSLAKARELSLGFQAGVETFLEMAKLYVSEEEYEKIFDRPYPPEVGARFVEYLNFTKQSLLLRKFEKGDQRRKNMLVQSWLQVQDFRKKRPGLAGKDGLWKRMQAEMLRSANVQSHHVVELPSWRKLYYYDLKVHDGAISGVVERGSDERRFFHGGKIVGNCLARETEVLTQDRGWVTIVDVTPNDLLWDGEEFVSHGGVVGQGKREVINFFGLEVTPEHQFLTVSGSWATAADLSHDKTNTLGDACMAARENRGTTIRVHRSSQEDRIERTFDDLAVSMRLRSTGETIGEGHEASEVLRSRLPVGEEAHRRPQEDTREVEASDVQRVAFHEEAVLEQGSPGVSQLRRSWDCGLRPLVGLVSELLGRHGLDIQTWAGSRSDQQRGELRAVELSMGDTQGERSESSCFKGTGMGSRQGGSEQDFEGHIARSAPSGLGHAHCVHETPGHQAEVFDILDCGPRRRFAVRAPGAGEYLIAHNCVSATARDIFVEDQLRLDAAGIWVILDIYDEVVTEVPVDFDGKQVQQLMTVNPDWAKTLPMGASCEESYYYKK